MLSTEKGYQNEETKGGNDVERNNEMEQGKKKIPTGRETILHARTEIIFFSNQILD